MIGWVAGFANYGGRIFIEDNYISANETEATVLIHEMGHVMYMAHTFQGQTGTPDGQGGTIAPYSCPSNLVPSIDGDGVADTDPHTQDQTH